MKRGTYTVWAVWDDRPKGRPAPGAVVEEVDVQSYNASNARLKAATVLDNDYKLGWRIFRVRYSSPVVTIQSWSR